MSKRCSLVLILAVSSIAIADAAAPGPPQTLVGVVSGATVTLTWSAPTTGSLPGSYRVEVALSPAGLPVATLSVAASPMVVSNVPSGVYYVRVRGVNAEGTSEPSNEVVVAVPSSGGSCSAPPGAPSNLIGGASGNLVTLNWMPPTSGCPVASYVVQAGTAQGLSDITVANVGAATSLSAGAPAGRYYVRVVAVNAFGASAASNEVVMTVGSSCPTPEAPRLLPPVVFPSTPTALGTVVFIMWEPVAATTLTFYAVEAGSSPGAVDLLRTTPIPAVRSPAIYNWTNIQPGTSYVRVRAVNICGESPPSNEVSVVVTGSPTRPPIPATINACTIAPDFVDCGPNGTLGVVTLGCNDATFSCAATVEEACLSHGGIRCRRCPGPLCP